MVSKSKKPPSSSSSTGEKYQNMTLDELANLDGDGDGDYDEEIDEEEAFNSEDERTFGKYLSSSTKIRSKNLSLPIPLQHNTVRIVEIARGSKMTLSSICLDVSRCDFDQVKLAYRCVYPNQPTNQVDDYSCLCNYLSATRGGVGMMPSTPVNLEVIGPCKLEFRAEISPLTWVGGGINIFGVILPVDHVFGDDVPFEYADAFMSEEEGIASGDESAAESASTSDNNGKHSTGASLNATKKRKLEEEKVDENPAKHATPTPAPESTPSADLQTSNKKLTKKQRKKLAQEKARQLEETLTAERNDPNNEHDDTCGPAQKKSKKKKKKHSSEEMNGNSNNPPLSKPSSLTRERRLAGGLVISDILLGTGAPVKPGKRISLHYTGSLRSTSKVFDKNNSKQHPLVFRQGTGEVIRGLERGLEGMKVGGERVIAIPSKLGYGSKGAGEDIPPDSDLVFEVKVLKVG